VGAHLAELLAYEGHDVVVVDRDPNSFKRLGGAFNGIILEGMAFDEELLRQAGIRNADALAAVTNHDNTNLMAAEIAKDIFGVRRVTARLYNPDKKETFHRLGIDCVCGTDLIAERVRDKLLQGRLIVHYEDPDLGMEIVELAVGDESRDKRIASFHDLEKNRILALFNGTRNIQWDGDTRLRAGDRLVLAVREGTRKILSVYWTDPAWRRTGSNGAVAGDARSTRPLSRSDREARVVVAGCGRVGAQVAGMLSLDGYRVAVIDKEAASFKRLPKSFSGQAIAGHSFDEDTLARAGIGEADLFAAVTNYDNTNLMTAEVVKHIFGVPKVIARLYNPDKEETFEALGMDYVCGTELVAREMLEKILDPDVKILSSCCNNTRNIIKFNCPGGLSGKKASWCEDNLRLKIGFINRRQSLIFPIGDQRLQPGDEIVALVAPRYIRKIERYIKTRRK
jgi:trk system potassium uptake protein TrkA